MRYHANEIVICRTLSRTDTPLFLRLCDLATPRHSTHAGFRYWIESGGCVPDTCGGIVDIVPREPAGIYLR